MTTGDTQRSELCWISGRKTPPLLHWANEGPHRPLKTGGLCCPHPWEEHLITQVTFCMSALNLPLTREPLQTWLQTGGIRWDYRPRCPLLFCRPSLASSTRPLPPSIPSPLTSPLSPPHPPVRPWHCYREAVHWQAETRKPPISSPLSQPHANTLSRIFSERHGHTHAHNNGGVLSF